MADTVTAFPDEQRIAGAGWSLRAERVEVLGGGAWRALIGVRRDLKPPGVRVGPGGCEVEVEAWAAEPEDSDGVAVIDAGDGVSRVARVPLCGCGERGCGNAGVQFGKWLPGRELPALVGLLREFPWSEIIPTHSNVLRGAGLAAIAARSMTRPQPRNPSLAAALAVAHGPGSRGEQSFSRFGWSEGGRLVAGCVPGWSSGLLACWLASTPMALAPR